MDANASASRGSSRQVRVVIDSRSRNRSTYPSPSRYEVDLPQDVFMVGEMRLLYADVPFSSYTISPGDAQNVVVSLSDSARVTAQIPVGDYGSGDAIAAGLTTALDAAAAAAGSAQTFSVAYVARRDSFDLRSSAPFSIDGASFVARPSTARLLGFPAPSDASPSYQSVASDDGSGWSELVSAPYRRAAEACPYLVMRVIVPSSEGITSPLPAADRSFAIIPRSPSTVNVDDMNPFAMVWKPPLARVSRVRVEFCDPDGHPYDFQNQDHRIDLMLSSSAHQLV